MNTFITPHRQKDSQKDRHYNTDKNKSIRLIVVNFLQHKQLLTEIVLVC